MLKEEIACSFQTFDLESPPHFVALSYTWGDAEDVAFSAAGDTVLPPVPLIRVNKEKFAVTRNLFDALIALRKQKLRSCIWIDALCINQDDTNERNAQVSVMDQIYQSASQVLVWLGPDVRDDARKVQQLMRKLARWHDEVRFDEVLEAQIGGTVFTAIEVVHNASLPRFGAEDLLDWTCFVRFFRRRWFFRTWTVQELALSQEVRFFCSGTEFPVRHNKVLQYPWEYCAWNDAWKYILARSPAKESRYWLLSKRGSYSRNTTHQCSELILGM
jgi:hypothetical protein